MLMFPVISTYAIRGRRAKDDYFLPLYVGTEYAHMMVKKCSVAKPMTDEQFWPLASMTNYSMSESKCFN
jgi:hypothetical protein